ncbi:hypothetical protein [Nitrosopumilus sp. Nsub]|uniref:hypothetical protein n=1 Tax=Nitrosopumilus sp. Nsub TaxID=1776294 RepID=UPI00082F810D|nr:hypothetical protein [Nitrosopumilus sp. Nsub]
MKSLIIFSIVLLFVITPAYGQLLSDATGLINRIDIQTSGHDFEVVLTSNFDLIDYSFDKNSKQFTLYLDSGLENNLGELVIPSTLLNGDLTFYLNDQEFFPKIQSSERVHFITMEFSGSGSNVISISGTEYLVGMDEIIPLENDSSETSDDDFLPPDGQFDTTSFDNNLVWLIVGGIVVAIVVVVAIKFVKK